MDIYWVHRQEHTDHMFVVPSSWSIRLPSLPNSPEWKKSEVAQSCQTLCNPMDCSLSGSSVYGIFQARVLEWIAISFSRGSSRPRNRTQVSCIAGRRLYHLSHQGSPKRLRVNITIHVNMCSRYSFRQHLLRTMWHLFTCRYLLETYFVPGTVLGTKMHKNACSHRAYAWDLIARY